MNNSSTQRCRKTPKQYQEEHELFIILMQEQKTSLEIMAELGLSTVQYRRHLLDALTSHEVVNYQPSYETIKGISLPAVIRKKLGIEGNSLVKIQSHETGILLVALVAHGDSYGNS